MLKLNGLRELVMTEIGLVAVQPLDVGEVTAIDIPEPVGMLLPFPSEIDRLN